MLPKCRNSSEARNHILFAMVPKLKDHCRSRGMFENTFRGFGKNKAKTLAWRKKPGLAVAGITKKPLDDTSINGRYFNKKRTQDFEVSATQVKPCTRRRYISYAITLPTSQELSWSLKQLLYTTINCAVFPASIPLSWNHAVVLIIKSGGKGVISWILCAESRFESLW